MDFKAVLQEYKPLIWAEYQKYLPGKSSSPHPLDPVHKYQLEDDYFWKIITDYPKRQGKYVRGVLIVLAAEAMGVPREKALLTAAAMQASEDWILMHDDWEDESEERRGGPALQKLYPANQAVNAGDLLHDIQYKMLRDNDDVLDHQTSRNVFNEMIQMMERTVLGQSVEMKWINENKLDLTDDDLFFVIGGKTSYYTIAGPLRLGALIAGATQQQLDALFEFGTKLGRCFQIRDDLLDLTSDFEGQKKQQCNDLYEGKRTIPLLHLYRSASKTDQQKLKTILDKPRSEKTEEEVSWILTKMKEYGSLDYAQKVASKLADEAQVVLDQKLGFLSHEPARTHLKEAIHFILNRTH